MYRPAKHTWKHTDSICYFLQMCKMNLHPTSSLQLVQDSAHRKPLYRVHKLLAMTNATKGFFQVNLVGQVVKSITQVSQILWPPHLVKADHTKKEKRICDYAVKRLSINWQHSPLLLCKTLPDLLSVTLVSVGDDLAVWSYAQSAICVHHLM